MALTKVSGDFLQDGSITQGHLHASHGITTSDIGEGSNLYFTTARVDSRIGDLSTSDLSEGTNLYYTDARADARITLQVGSNLDLSSKSTSDLSEGTNLYYTQARFNTAFTAKSTSDLSEGTNLYYTDARADARIAAASTSDLSEGANLYYTDARADARITAADTDALSEGSTNLYYTDARADARVALIVDSAPGTLDTLNELAAALGDDANFSTTVTNSIATKLPLAGGTMTGRIIQTQHSTTLGNSSYASEAAVTAQATNTTNAYPGYGFHKAGQLGLFLYATDRSTLRQRGDDGTDVAIWNTGDFSSTNVSNWDTAYGWGDHGAAGYATSATTLAGYGITNAIQKGADITSGASWTTATKFNSTGDLSQAAGNHALSVNSANGNDAFMSFHIASDYAIHFGLDGATNRMHVGGWSEGTGTQYQLYDSRDFSVASVLNSNVTLATLGYTGATNANYITNNNQLTNGAGYTTNTGTLTNSNDRFYLTDTRDASRAPSYYDDRYIQGDFSQSAYFGVSGGDAWAGILTVSKWSSWDASHRQEQLIFAGTKLARRVATSDTAWSSTYDIIDTSGVNNAKAGYIQSNASLRAPIFYDSNDTNYYVDPAATSQTKAISIMQGYGFNLYQSGNGSYAYQDARADGSYSAVHKGTNNGSGYGPYKERWYDGNSYHSIQISSDRWNFDSPITAATDMQAPIFYDSNNTGYYVNPEGDSNFGGDLAFTSGAIGSIADGSSTANQVSRIVFPQGGAGSWDGGQTGAIKIRLPIRANNNMWSMKVRIYNYGTNISQEYFLGNYSYSNGGWNSQASFHGGESSTPQNVRFGNDGTSDCVWIGETNTTWSYPVVSVLDFQAGFRGASIATNIDNYDVSIVTSFGTVQTMIAPNTKAGYIVYADSSFRAPIFYDSNDTGYYTNPAGESKIKKLWINNGGGSGVGWSTGLNMGDGSNYWNMIQDGGVARQRNFGTGGYDWFSGGATQIMTLSNAGTLFAAADMRSPIFYDSNDTSYYANPASTSDLKLLRTGKNHQVNAVRWDTSFYVAQSQHYYGHTSSQSMYLGESNYINIRNTADIHGDARSPIYYDRANTAYYTRPASSSSMYSIYTSSFVQVGASGSSSLWLGGQSGNYFRFHTNNSDTYFDANVGNIYWRQGSSTRFYFYMSTSNITINGTLTQNSDERVKENIVEIPNALEKINAMRGIYYNRTDTNTEVKKIGVIAQEVETVLPEVILEAPDTGLKSVAYAELTAVLINGIKEQQVIIDDLKARIEILENQ